jgi:hypothetical protein
MTTKEDALRLLRVLDVHQAKGREGTVVVPREWAFCAHLRAGTQRYEAALWCLVDEGALARARRSGAIVGGQPHGDLYWRMTGAGPEDGASVGERGLGNFPARVSHLRGRNRLWRWSDVAAWADAANAEDRLSA